MGKNRMWWCGCLVLLCACAASTQRIDQEAMLRGGRIRDRDITKNDEPTCDQLKAMWRFSKRQARAPEILNEVSTYRDPLEVNMWPVYTALPRAAPRFRYQYALPRDGPSYGRVVTKAPPNVVRSPDYDGRFGYLNVPRNQEFKILRSAGPSRPRSSFMIPPQKDRFDELRNEIRKERQQEIERMLEAEQKQHIKQLAAGHGREEYMYGEAEGHGLQGIDSPEELPMRHALMKPKPQGNRQLQSFSRYSDIQIPQRRTFYHPYIPLPALLPYPY